MSSRRTAGLVVLAIAPAIGIMALGFAAIARDGAWGVCFSYGLRLLFWSLGCCLVGAFLCAILFAVCRAPPVTYVLLVAALAVVAAVGSYLAASAETDCSPAPADPFTTALSLLISTAGGLAASFVGLLPGYLVGLLVRNLFGLLIRGGSGR